MKRQNRLHLSAAYERAYRPAPGVIRRKKLFAAKPPITWRITPKLLSRAARGIRLSTGERQALKDAGIDTATLQHPKGK